jgi:hypothetical protein
VYYVGWLLAGLEFITINSLYTFGAGSLLIIRKYCIYSNWYILCVLCRLAAIVVYTVPPNKCSKHVKAINCDKLKANSASCWSYHTDMLRCTVNRTLSCFVSLLTEKSHVNGPLKVTLSSNSGSEVLGEKNENEGQRNTAFPF